MNIVRFKWTVIFAVLFGLLFVPAYFLNDNNRNIDDTSYLSHAMTLGIDFDLDYSNEVAIKFNKDKTIPSHFIGTGALVAPFVAVFSAIDRLTGHEVIHDRYNYFTSWSYFGFLFGINFYFLLAVVMMYQVLNEVFMLNRTVVVLAVVSSGVLYYVLGRFMMSHGMEFFASAATIYFVHRLLKQEKTKVILLYSILIGFITTLGLWIRPSNYHMLLLPFISYLFFSVLLHHKVNIKIIFYIIAAIFISLLPFFYFSDYFFHSIIPSTTAVYGRDLMQEMGMPNGILNKFLYVLSLTPNLLLVFFSSEIGILYSSPIIVLGIIGAIYFFIQKYKQNKSSLLWIFSLTFIYFAFPFAIVLVWKTTASDYGYRYLFSLIPLSLLFFGYMYVKVSSKRYLKLLVYLLFIIGVLNLFFYKTTPELFPQTHVNVYGKYHEASLKGYEFNLMHEIINPKTWILGMGKTYFGFLVAKPALKTKLVNLVPKRIRDKYIQRFENIPFVIYIQTFSIMILWALFGYFLDRRKKI